MKVIDNLLALVNTPQRIFDGHYLLSSAIFDNTLYELQLITHMEYELSLLIDDTWAYSDFLHQDILLSTKVVYYLVHPSVPIQKKRVTIDDPEYLYYLPFSKIEKFFLGQSEYQNFKLTDDVWKVLEGDVVYTLKASEKQIPIISIVTTVFNNAKLLEQTVQSVINQNNSQIEYVVKDAGSNDNFQEVIDKYKDYIDIVLSQPDEGIYDGMHQGILASHGKYVQVLNSDDIYNVDSTFAYTNALKKSSYDWYAASLFFHQRGKCEVLKPNHKLNHNLRVNHTTIAMKKTFYCNLGGFDLGFKCAADRNLIIRALKISSSNLIIGDCVAHFRAEGLSSRIGLYRLRESFKCLWLGYKWDVIGYCNLFVSFMKFLLKGISFKIRKRNTN